MLMLLLLLYPLLGFVGGPVTAWFYNLAANLVGGVRIDLETRE